VGSTDRNDLWAACAAKHPDFMPKPPEENADGDDEPPKLTRDS
jgi:hypothetical protein